MVAALAVAVVPAVAAADTPANDATSDQALYPAAQCAALWYGFDDYARLSAMLDRNEGDPERAEAFKAVAYRLDSGRTDRVDAFVKEQRGLMLTMIDAMIYAGDEPSRDLFRRLTETCESFAAKHPETEALR